MLTEKAPYPCCQENPGDCGKFSWIHFEEPDFNNGTALRALAGPTSTSGVVLGFPSARVEYLEAAVGTDRQLQVVGCIRTSGIGDVLRCCVVASGFVGEMKLPQCLQPGRFRQRLKGRSGAALLRPVVHDRNAGR